MRRFLRRQIPAYVDGTLNIVGVQDVARGHLLADEQGRIGERYLLGNRNFTMTRLFADLGRLSGVQPPMLKLPVHVAMAVAGTAQRAGAGGLPTATEVRAASLNWRFSNRKAKRELGWTTSPHEDCLEETIAWYRDRDGAVLAPPGARQPLPLRLPLPHLPHPLHPPRLLHPPHPRRLHPPPLHLLSRRLLLQPQWESAFAPPRSFARSQGKTT